MTCRDLLSAIDPYLDGELCAFETLRMHGHLVACDRCQKVLESEATLHSLLAKLLCVRSGQRTGGAPEPVRVAGGL